MTEMNDCVFCRIIRREELADIVYEDDSVIVFRNLLKWAPLMLLAVPKRHMTQEEMWRDMTEIGPIATRLGQTYSPNGFRLLSNFGPEGGQSQEHAHLHILGGRALGRYVSGETPAI
jgi:histidine triad (HIT) family protein